MLNKTYNQVSRLTKNIRYFEGVSGIKSLYNILISSWKPKDEYFIASAPIESFEKLEDFFLNTVHKKRIKDKVIMKILINRAGESYAFVRKNMPYTQVRFLEMNSKSEYGVLNDLVFIVDYGENPSGVLIKDRNSAETFREIFKILWGQGRKISLPPLTYTEMNLSGIIKSYKSYNPIIVTDSFNYPQARKLADSVCILNNSYQNIESIKEKMRKNKNYMIIGLGGCTALDAARGVSTPEIPVVLIPSILSTVCISVDKSVFNYNGEDKLFQTENPQKIIISWSLIFGTNNQELIKWSQSGFGDLFAKIGASIDVVFREISKTGDELSLEKVRRKIPETFDALEWVLNKFEAYDKKDLKTLSLFLHEASVSIILLGGFELSGGAEHDLAYAIGKKHKYGKDKWPTHGQIVSIGTLIELRLFGEITGDFSIYEKMIKAYKKLGLPTSYKELEKIGIKKEYLIEGIKEISQLNTFLSYHHKKAIALLDKIFSKEKQ